MIDQLDAGQVMDKGEDLEKRDEQQRFRDQIGQKHAGRQHSRAPELHPRQRKGGQDADHHRHRDDDYRHQRRVLEEGQELRLAQQVDVVLQCRMVHPPRIGHRADLRARFERGDEHVDRRHQKENDEQDQEEIRPIERPLPAARNAAVVDRAALRGADLCGCRGHSLSLVAALADIAEDQRRRDR